nr:PKD domain-containing protein [Actinomycetota bacterium]
AAARSQAGAVRTIGQSIAAIALGQAGVSATPAETSFAGLDCDPYSTLVGALSPNADGCGLSPTFKVEDENEAWCSDFAKWVWQQAGVTTGLSILNAGSGSFYDWGLAQGEQLPADGGSPAAGDAVVFFPPGHIGHPAYGDHVGIVTAVNPGGTVNLVDGDFLGTTNISVQYDTKVSLTSWAAQIWGPGEQWALIAPPASTQRIAPAVTISAPQVAVAGTLTSFSASGTVPGGSVTQYQWTFGDGRTANQGGPAVNAVFPGAGIYPVTLTATSNTGTVTTRAYDVDVVGASSAVTSIPSDAVWYSTTPVDQYLFLPAPAGGLAAESSDGAGGQSWLRQSLPGQPGAGGGLTALAYPDRAAGDAMVPHAYYRSSGGTLAETYPGGASWTTKTLPGQPVPGTALVATTAGNPQASAGAVPAVFYFGTAGQLNETVEQGTSWVTSTLPALRTADVRSLALADTGGRTAGIQLYSLGAPGTLTVTAENGHGWQSTSISSPYGVAASSPLSAVSTSAAVAGVFFVDARGKLAEANQAGPRWAVHELPGTTGTTALEAASHPVSSSLLGSEVFWLAQGGKPALTAWTGQQWQTSMLPGAATSIAAVSVYPGQATELFLGDATTLQLDANEGSGTAWTSTTLPGTAATLGDRVLLYGATPGDVASARSAAAAAGLPAGRVTGSFSTAWAAALSDNYLVIAVGATASNALYFNTCGWADPSGEGAGGTPFDLARAPLNRLPGVDLYEDGAAATVSQTPPLSADLAYYATHGTLPPKVTKLPAAAAPARVCSGQPG